MAILPDYYKTIGVSLEATQEQIKAAYRKLAKKYHPDAHPDDMECEKRFREINEAYSVLGDVTKRKQYDAERKAAFRGGGKEQGKKNEQRYGAGGVDFSDIQKSFENFFGFRPEGQDMTSGQETKRENPLDTTNLFERFMGIKR